MTQDEGFPVSRLQERYGLGEYQSVINRYKLLGIVPFKKGRQSFITEAQLQALDDLNEWKKANPSAKLSDFPGVLGAEAPGGQMAVIEAESREIERTTGDTEITLTVSELSQLVRSVTAKPIEPLAYLKELERAAAAGWLLTSSEVKALIGVKPSVKGSDRTFVRGSFAFSKIPLKNEEGKPKFKKIGGQTAWRVSKIVE
ncbi:MULTISPECIES: hypothetical protein [Cyanophyceae]|uniref:hypothetical protein n=1 Tax=Cyanophyceae TaxID=3028117 RepID=UPI0016871F69|nr:hypothetical protein [Trichocoleus sp. FACHB-40]MBD2006471.1 hypothetical protein [Trichocoleus sp. FACHB-40]